MRYREGASRWELMIVFRRSFAVFFSAMLIYFQSSTVVLSFTAFLVYFLAQLVHQYVQPYNDHTLNQLDDISLFSINLTILCGIFFQTQELDRCGVSLRGTLCDSIYFSCHFVAHTLLVCLSFSARFCL